MANRDALQTQRRGDEPGGSPDGWWRRPCFGRSPAFAQEKNQRLQMYRLRQKTILNQDILPCVYQWVYYDVSAKVWIAKSLAMGLYNSQGALLLPGPHLADEFGILED